MPPFTWIDVTEDCTLQPVGWGSNMIGLYHKGNMGYQSDFWKIEGMRVYHYEPMR